MLHVQGEILVYFEQLNLFLLGLEEVNPYSYYRLWGPYLSSVQNLLTE